MSSLDSQVLAVGTMFTQDVVRHYGFHDLMTEVQQVLCARLFVTSILVATFIASLLIDHSIFRLAIWSFTGFASLFPVIVAALFWRRATAVGAIAGVAAAVVLWIYFFVQGWSNPTYSVMGTGVMPVVVTFIGSCLALIVGSLLSRPISSDVLSRILDPVQEHRL